MNIKAWWPFMLKSEHEQVRRENIFLKSALCEANAELRKHRLLINGLRQGREDITQKFEKVLRSG